MKLALANKLEMGAASLGEKPMSEVRTASVEGWVNTGAAHLVLPKAVVEKLGLDVAGQTRARLADSTVIERDYVKQVWLSLTNRDGVFSAVVKPNREDALIGAIVLEALDLYVDPVTGECLPRDPEHVLAELGGPEWEPVPR